MHVAARTGAGCGWAACFLHSSWLVAGCQGVQLSSTKATQHALCNTHAHTCASTAEVLKAYADATAAPVLAVSGNVDDVPGAAQLLPPHRVLTVAGWKLLLVHVVAPGPQAKGGQ